MPDEMLRLPRTLVNLLLRQAQRASGRSQGFVLRDGNGHYRCEPLAANAELQVTARQARVQAPLAFYRSSNTPLPPLTAAQTAALAGCTPVFLDIALDTKGVLQLRGGRLTDGRVAPLAVVISETVESELLK